MRWLTALFVLGGTTASARAEHTVGVAIIGDPALTPAVTTTVSTWLNHHGLRAAPLSADAVGTVTDCMALVDEPCTRAAFAKVGIDEGVVVVVRSDNGAVVLDGHWLAKDRAAIKESTPCGSCSDADRGAKIDGLMTSLAGAASAIGPAKPTTSVTTTSSHGPAGRTLAVGVELGEPTSATLGWFAGKLALTGALGSGTFAGAGPSAHAEARIEVSRLSDAMRVRAGAGLRYYHHGYDAASTDEIPDTHYGVRALGELSIDRGALQLYVELAPGVDFKRTSSCTLGSGVDTICPHAQQMPVFLDLGVGARWFLK